MEGLWKLNERDLDDLMVKIVIELTGTPVAWPICRTLFGMHPLFRTMLQLPYHLYLQLLAPSTMWKTAVKSNTKNIRPIIEKATEKGLPNSTCYLIPYAHLHIDIWTCQYMYIRSTYMYMHTQVCVISHRNSATTHTIDLPH